jgi:ribosome-binding protein aMBF1 (putative translation factor)
MKTIAAATSARIARQVKSSLVIELPSAAGCTIAKAKRDRAPPNSTREYILIWDIQLRLAIIRTAVKRIAYRDKYRSFLSRLKNARVEAGMTQVAVARQLARPQSFVSKCESGERRVDVVELQEFARLYSKPLSFFIS